MLMYDIIIVGSGIVGATTALSLAKNTSLQIALIDANPIPTTWDYSKHDFRVSAISLASQQIFQKLDVWKNIQAKRFSPYKKMFVWDAASKGEIQFDCRSIQASSLGHIIEDSVVRASIIENFSRYPNLKMFAPIKLMRLQETNEHVELMTDTNEIFQTKLLIGADGRNSWVRQQANLQVVQRDYSHTAIVTTVKTEHIHQQTAWQRFLPTGPLAFLPLANANTCSIVWSTLPSEALRLLDLDNVVFQQELTRAIDNKLGHVIASAPRYSFNLHMRHVKNYIKPRLALVGDAAHTIHPLAGQGVNLGLLDSAALVEVIVEAINKNKNFASLENLRRYERARKAENTLMLNFVSGIKQLFENERSSIKSLRNFGMNMTNNSDLLKNFFVECASGSRSLG